MLKMAQLHKRQRSESEATDLQSDEAFAGAKALWTKLRELKSVEIAMVCEPKLLEFQDAWGFLQDAARQKAQKDRLLERYAKFVSEVDASTNEWKAVKKYVKGALFFNGYLGYDDDDDPKAHFDWIYDEPGDERPEPNVYALYTLLGRCPRLAEPAIFLHSTKNNSELPHNDGVGYANPFSKSSWEAQVGKGCVNTTFMSTSLAPLENYLMPPLSEFYRRSWANPGCCMCAITVDAGVPILPIAFQTIEPVWNDGFKGEQEVLLPPGIVLVFQGMECVNFDRIVPNTGRVRSHKFRVFFYRAVLPSVVGIGA